MPEARRATLHSDGGARGNPGPAGIGFVLRDESGETLVSGGRFIGETTNNIAEYEALIWGLENAARLGIHTLRVHADSELLVKQVNGQYRVKHPNLKPLFARVRTLLSALDDVEVVHVRREHNRDADRLANEAMDARGTVGDAETSDTGSDQPSLF